MNINSVNESPTNMLLKPPEVCIVNKLIYIILILFQYFLRKNTQQSEKTDSYALGVLLYYILVGKLPIYAENQQTLINIFKNKKEIDYIKDIGDNVLTPAITRSCEKLISNLLQIDKELRINLQSQLFEDWYNDKEYDNIINIIIQTL